MLGQIVLDFRTDLLILDILISLKFIFTGTEQYVLIHQRHDLSVHVK